MRITDWINSTLLSCAILTVFVSPIKLCPAIFLLFTLCVAVESLAIPLARLREGMASLPWLGCLIYLFYVATVYATVGGASDVAFRVLVNGAFFLAAAFYLSTLVREGRERCVIQCLTYALLVAIVFSFLQTLVNVSVGHLWTLPIHIQSSADAYAIQYAAPILFGDKNKNIWATKTLFSYLLFVALRRQLAGSSSRWTLTDWAGCGLFLFTLVYLSSRTAQMAFLVACSGYMIAKGSHKPGAMRRILIWTGSFAILGLSVFFLRLSAAPLELDNGNQGDGLLARIILWGYLYTNLPSFSFAQILHGHGVFAVSDFVNAVFDETNLHNVFLNQFYDYGLIGMLFYCCFLWYAIRTLEVRWRWLLIPALAVVINSQNLGHDPELMIYYAFTPLLSWNALYLSHGRSCTPWIRL